MLFMCSISGIGVFFIGFLFLLLCLLSISFFHLPFIWSAFTVTL